MRRGRVTDIAKIVCLSCAACLFLYPGYSLAGGIDLDALNYGNYKLSFPVNNNLTKYDESYGYPVFSFIWDDTQFGDDAKDLVAETADIWIEEERNVLKKTLFGKDFYAVNVTGKLAKMVKEWGGKRLNFLEYLKNLKWNAFWKYKWEIAKLFIPDLQWKSGIHEESGKDIDDKEAIYQEEGFGVRGMSGSRTIVIDNTIDVRVNAEMHSSSKFVWIQNLESISHANTDAEAAGIVLGGDNNTVVIDRGVTVTAGEEKKGSESYAGSRTAQDFPIGLLGDGSYSKANSIAFRKATGIDIGNGDNNSIMIGKYWNLEVNSYAWAKALSDSASYGYLGLGWSWIPFFPMPANSTAKAYAQDNAISIGIVSGDGRNTITNEGLISAYSLAETESTSKAVGVVWGWEVHAKSQANADSLAFGILAGDGAKTITNIGAISGKAVAIGQSKALSTPLVWGIDTIADAGNIVNAYAMGIQAGDGSNQIENTGTISIEASSDARGTESRAYAVVPSYSTYAGSFSKSTSAGIAVGEGMGSTIHNKGGVFDNSISAAGFSIDSFPWSSPTWGDVGALGNAEAVAFGIRTGAGAEARIVNDNTIEVLADSSLKISGTDQWDRTSRVLTQSAGISADNTSEITDGGGIRTGKPSIVTNNGIIRAIAKGEARDGGGGILRGSIHLVEAKGIEALACAYKVENFGTIEAVATGDRIGETFGETFLIDAVGIRTGSGDDTIVNNGRIVTKVSVWNGTSYDNSVGVGIDSGGGNDGVLLGQSSRVEGSIELGDGDDAMEISSGAVVTGDISGGPGTDRLLLSGDGSLARAVSGLEVLSKVGEGTFSVEHLDTVPRMEIRQGTLKVGDAYAMNDNCSLWVGLDPAGRSGKLWVHNDNDNATLSLAGMLTAEKTRNRPYSIGTTTYDIVQADRIEGQFGTVNLPDNTHLVKYDLLYEVGGPADNLVKVTVAAKPFRSTSRNPADGAVAGYLDSLVPTATGDLAALIGAAQLLPESELPAAFASLSPASYDSGTLAAFGVSMAYFLSVRNRLNDLRAARGAFGAGAGAGSSSAPAGIRLAYDGQDASVARFVATGQPKPAVYLYDGWWNGFSRTADQDASPGYPGFRSTMMGTSFGADKAFGERVYLGAGFGWSDTQVDLDDNWGDGSIGSKVASLYGTWFTRNAYLEGAVSYGWHDFSNSRHVLVDTFERIAQSDHKGNSVAGFLGGGYRFPVGEWGIAPYALLQYVRLDEDGFQETGADNASLAVGARSSDSLVSELGVRVARAWKTKHGYLIPEFGAAWGHDFDVDDRPITASLVGAPGTSFTVQGQDVGQDGAVLGLGLTYVQGNGLAASLRYEGEFRDDSDTHALLGEVRISF